MKKKVDYIIVGQGIAGTLLAFQLIRNGKTIMVIDRGYTNSSSYVAAGLINPTVLKRITKTWRAAEFTEYNDSFYEALQQFLGGHYYHKLDFSKLINSPEEKDFWVHRYEQEDVNKYIEKELETVQNKEQYTVGFVEGKVKKAAWLNIKPLLKDFRNHLKSSNSIIEKNFDYEALELKSNGVIYGEIQANKVIFCEGSKVASNPYFKYIPMVLNKGELLTISSSDFKSEKVLKKKVFIIPIDKNTYKVGSTFEWNWETEKPTKSKKEELELDLKKISTRPYKVINHEAGVRPSSRDRRPIIGLHPEHEQLAIFNGLGSRGCLISPLLTEEFNAFLNGVEKINEEADLKRFSRFRLNSTS